MSLSQKNNWLVAGKSFYLIPKLRVKALANEDTLLRTHCCPRCFLGSANWETFVADTKCFWTKSETFLCPGHKMCVRNKCCARGQTGKHLCRQQCVLVCQGLKDGSAGIDVRRRLCSHWCYWCYKTYWFPAFVHSKFYTVWFRWQLHLQINIIIAEVWRPIPWAAPDLSTLLFSDVRVSISQGNRSSKLSSPIPRTMAPRARDETART